ncbi:hypothetical protein [Pseudarthrobacter sulfonivorans]|uniref:hypothetical protein n=1 Tax=Pseudarthrobacter sulfonivorans TaxID=121292 RepID=UPI00285E7D2D|nr:hypothetical protein [Pseudarthrobacter sulfonivorans]MDR6416877.1 hypothetical protein [Pseudarthrobacter sulfonivorans]
MDAGFPARHVARTASLHELVSTKMLAGRDQMQAEQPFQDVQPPLAREPGHTPAPIGQEGAKLGEKYSKNLAQLMSSTQHHSMNR